MLEVKNVAVSFPKEQTTSLFKREREQVLYDINFKIKKGICLGMLGESGSGKSTLAKVLCGLLRPERGEVLIEGKDIYKSSEAMKQLRKQISIVFQDYTTSVNPRFKVHTIIEESLRLYERRHHLKLDYKKEVSELLHKVGLEDSLINRYPHELSGGQLQRVCIARAIASRPQLIILDEAISSLDAHTQVQIMDLLQNLKEELGLTYLFITHDLTAITYFCDEVLFLYHGKITEHILVDQLSQVQDPYALKLLESIIDF